MNNDVENLSNKIIIDFFAHTNSAKCCCKDKPRRKENKGEFFKNCRRYIPGEIELLNPDVLILQGNHAKEVIESIEFKKIFRYWEFTDNEDIFIVSNNNHKMLIVKQFHPTAQGGYNKKAFNLYSNQARKAAEFIANYLYK